MPELWQEHWEDFAERPRLWVFSAQDPIFQLLPGTIRPLNLDSGSEKEAVSTSNRPLEADRDSDQQGARNSVKAGSVPLEGQGSPPVWGK